MSSQDFITQAINYSIGESKDGFGYELPNDLIIDGNFHSYNGKRSDGKRAKKEVYVATQYDSGLTFVTFWSRTNDEQKHTYRSWNESQLTPEERKKIREESKRYADMVNQCCEEEYRVAAKKAKKHWDAATPCTTHPYLEKKGVKSHGLRSLEGKLVIPIYDAETDELQSLQFIWPDGKKRFLTGGKVKNGYFRVGEGKKPFIGEGYATAATAFEATGQSSIFAVSAAQCAPAALHLRKRNKLTTARLLHDLGKAGDAVADLWKKHDLGDVCTPNWGGHDIPEKANDWNDLAVKIGLEEVARQLAPKSFPSISLTDFLKEEHPPKEWAIENCFEQGSSNIVHALPGCGKSMLATDMSIGCSGGLELPNGWKCRKQKVLFIDGELTPTLSQDRWKLALSRWSTSQKLDLEHIELIPWLRFQEECEQEMNLFCPAARARLDPLIEKSEFIVFDNFDSLTDRDGEADFRGDEADWAKVFKWTQRWSTKGKTFLFVMHSVKGTGALAGSRRMTGDTWTVIRLDALRDELKENPNNLGMIVRFSKNRSAEEKYKKPFALEMLTGENCVNKDMPWIQHDMLTLAIKAKETEKQAKAMKIDNFIKQTY